MEAQGLTRDDLSTTKVPKEAEFKCKSKERRERSMSIKLVLVALPIVPVRRMRTKEDPGLKGKPGRMGRHGIPSSEDGRKIPSTC